MPTISFFYGITIIMHLSDKEHNLPHIHAIYGEYGAAFIISSGKKMSGKFPKNGIKLVEEFINKYKNELNEMWKTGIIKKLPPIR